MEDNKLFCKIVKGKQKALFFIFAILYVIVAIIYDLYIYIIPGKWFVDSDMASEMILAQKLNDENGILSMTWHYSTELRVFCQQWFLRIGLLIYPDNWHRARMIGGGIMICVTAICMFMLFKTVFHKRVVALIASGIIIWPFGREYYVYAIWGLYYLAHIIFIMVLLTCFCTFIKADLNVFKKRILIVGVGALSFCAGLNGIRLIYSLFIPLFATSMIYYVIKKERIIIQYLLLSFYMMFWGVFGYLVNTLVLSKVYSFNTFNFLYWNGDFSVSIEQLFRNYLLMFGYQPNVSVFGFASVASMLSIVMAVIILFASFRLLFIYSKLQTCSQVLVLFYHVSLITHVLLFYFISYYSPQYFLTMIPITIIVIFIELENDDLLWKNKSLSTILLCCVISFCSVVSVSEEVKNPIYALYMSESNRAATDFLLNNGYSNGFASFWQANVLTELSNGKIEMWNIGWSLNEKSDLDILEWLQETNHAEKMPDGKVFIYYNRVTDGSIDKNELLKNGEMVFENGYYSIWSFDSIEDICR